MTESSIKVSEIEIKKMQNTEPYRRPFSKLEVKFRFSDSQDYATHRSYVERVLTKVIPNSRISSSCEYGGYHVRQNVNGSSTDKRTRFSITDSSKPQEVLVQCYEIKPDLAKEYINKVINLLKNEFKEPGIEVKGESLLDGKN